MIDIAVFGEAGPTFRDAFISHFGEADFAEAISIAEAIVNLHRFCYPDEAISIAHLAEAFQYRTLDRLELLATQGRYSLNEWDKPCYAIAVRATAILSALRGNPVSERELWQEYDYRNGGKLLITTDEDVNAWIARHVQGSCGELTCKKCGPEVERQRSKERKRK